MDEDVCKICGDKLRKKDNSAIYYCMKCEEAKNRKKAEIFGEGKK
jgi:ribosomal protein L37AE/L43A